MRIFARRDDVSALTTLEHYLGWTEQRRPETEEAGNIWIKAYLGALETGDGSAVAWWKRTPSKLRT